jgi:hypothetical protein
MARTASASVGTGATLNQDVEIGGAEYLNVIGITGTAANAASANGDISIVVLPYMDDAVGSGLPTLGPTTLNLPVLDVGPNVLVSSRAWIQSRFRVAGIQRVQIQAKNNNAGAKPVEINFGIR